MKKYIAFFLALVYAIGMIGCAAKTDTIVFHDKVFNKSDLSQETIEWLEWYNGLTDAEQLAVSYIPSDLYQLYGFPDTSDISAVEAGE